MAAYEQALLGLDIFTLFFAFLSIVALKRVRNYENSAYESNVQLLLFGCFFLFLSSLVRHAQSINASYHDLLASLLPNIDTYLGYFATISNIALLPLFAICVFVAVLLLWHHLPYTEPKASKDETSPTLDK